MENNTNLNKITGLLTSRIFGSVTISQIAAYLVALGLLLVGVSIVASQWTTMQNDISINREKLAASQAAVVANEQRIQNLHVRVAALETYNKELVESMKNMSADTKKMVDLLSLHISDKPSTDNSIKNAPDATHKE